jgi:hypothetical protein
VVTSQLVIDEASLGDPDAARRRLEALDGIPVLPANPDIDSIADEIIRRHMMPANVRLDACTLPRLHLQVYNIFDAKLHAHRQRNGVTQDLQTAQ